MSKRNTVPCLFDLIVDTVVSTLSFASIFSLLLYATFEFMFYGPEVAPSSLGVPW